MQLTSEEESFFKGVIFPLSYINTIWRRLSKKEKFAELRGCLQQKLENKALGKECQEALMRRGKEMAEIFQRSSS